MQHGTYFSLFSGIGGFELGIGKRAECVGFSEIDRYAVQIYQSHFYNHRNYGDITNINSGALPDFDLLVGGFPCQAFSLAGKRGGFADARGTLFFEIARILQDKHPRLLLFENVKGLLSHEGGETFKTIIRTLDELGYDLGWQVLNSKHHGVPQNRERVFIVGYLRGTRRPEVFPFREDDKENSELQGQQANTLTARYQGAEATGSYVIEGKSDAPEIVQVNKPKHSNDRVYGVGGVSPTLNTMQGGNRQPIIVASRGRNPKNPSDRTIGVHTEQRLEANTKGTSNTLTNVQKDNWLMENDTIRRLTPTECERLQGFPDGWTNGISDSQRYKCLGNAVTVPVIQAIASRLFQARLHLPSQS